MPFNTYDIERDFFTVVEEILRNQNCGYTLIRKGTAIIPESFNINYERLRLAPKTVSYRK